MGILSNIFDIRNIAMVQMMRAAAQESVQSPIMKYSEDESKVWILTAQGYRLFSKQLIADGYKAFMKGREE